ncbi:ABC transporter permease [Lachnobacterium bovis]|uniref:Putative ABC transport system permease protein n=1 Tax=Lachnobacterium bovis TaxID=140626 RepID=A0A1H9S3Y0_9FIRM|nr:ABC transporter permease [Lachnobacterium bovis]SER79063.1 putative ABC transport system permease protein [Lachnobacterium bovis]
MLENIRLSFSGILSHKMRSFLTMLGIIIGIAAIIVIVSTIEGANKQIEKNLIGSGNNNVSVEISKGDDSVDFAFEAIPEGLNDLEENQISELRNIKHVKKVATYKKRNEYEGVFYKDNPLGNGNVLGVSKNYLETCDLIIKKGRIFSKNDFNKYRKVVILDTTAEKVLFQGESSIGKTIEIKKEPYTVIGIVKDKKEFKPVINSVDDYYTYYANKVSRIFIPNTTWQIPYQYDEPSNVVLKVDKTSNLTSVGKLAAKKLNNNITANDTSIKYKAQNLLEQAKKIQELEESTNMMLIWIAGISLLVGGIGVMNIMLVSVTERTSEIGLKKAIGAKKITILGQFLTESVVLTSIGGIMGVLAGIGLAEVVSKINKLPIQIDVISAIVAVAFSMVIGIIFGIIPSYKAAKLEPIEALRRE